MVRPSAGITSRSQLHLGHVGMARRMTPVGHPILAMAAVLLLNLVLNQALAATPPSLEVDPRQAHLAVYEAVLRSWMGTDYSPILVSEQLSSVPKAGDPDVSDCLKGVDFQPAARVTPALRSLHGARFERKGVHLVDRAKWHPADGPLVAHVNQGNSKSLDSDLDRAMAHSLISFSQIWFDRTGQWALLSFSSVCGGLCGSGSVLLMHKSSNTWKVFRRCGGWVS